MNWNVYNHDINRKEIRAYNIFKHSSFNEDVQSLLKEDLTYEEFSEKLNRTARYYFWCKTEHEIVMTGIEPHIDNDELDRLNKEREGRQSRFYDVNLDIRNKVDIFDQLQLNWDCFARYVWDFKKNK